MDRCDRRYVRGSGEKRGHRTARLKVIFDKPSLSINLAYDESTPQTLQSARVSEQVTLVRMAAIAFEEVALCPCFHSFRNYFHSQAVAHSDDGLHDHGIGGFCADVAHKRLINLQLVQRKLRQRPVCKMTR